MLKLRTTADAVMCGARTAETSGVTLGTGGKRYREMRLRRGLAGHHLRIIVSGSGRVATQAEVFQHRFSPIVVLTTRRASATRLAQLRRVADEVAQFGAKELNLRAALRWLCKHWNVKRLICEGGGELNDALFRAIRQDTPHNEAENGAHSTMTAILGRMATYSGRELSWDEALASEIVLAPAELSWTADAPVNPDAKGLYPIPMPGRTRAV